MRAECCERDKQSRTEKGASLVTKECEQELNNLFMANSTSGPALITVG